MRWPGQKPPTIYREAPSKGDYAVPLAIVGVGLSTILLSGSPGEFDHPPAARIIEAVAGVALFGAGLTRLAEKGLHHSLINWPGSGELWSQIPNGFSTVHFITESYLHGDALHPRASRVYIVPQTDGEVAPGPEIAPPIPPMPPTPPVPPVPPMPPMPPTPPPPPTPPLPPFGA